MTAYTLLSSALLLVIYALTIRLQFFALSDIEHRRGPFSIISQYRLFSPRPIRIDVHLVMREFDMSGAARACREVPIHRLRHPLQAVWNPWKRSRLPFIGLMRQVTNLTNELGDDRLAVLSSTAYLALLARVSQEAGPDTAAVQFLLVDRFGFVPTDDTTVVFCSAVHRLDAVA